MKLKKEIKAAEVKSKLKATAKSSNFKVSLTTLILLTLFEAGANVNPDAAADLVEGFQSGDVFGLMMIAIPNVIQPVFKIISKGGWSFDFLKSVNFWVQFTTVALIGLSALGAVFPEGAASELVESIFGGDWAIIISAISINLASPLYHFFFDKKDGLVIEKV